MVPPVRDHDNDGDLLFRKESFFVGQNRGNCYLYEPAGELVCWVDLVGKEGLDTKGIRYVYPGLKQPLPQVG